jgi:hypothetical protein
VLDYKPQFAIHSVANDREVAEKVHTNNANHSIANHFLQLEINNEIGVHIQRVTDQQDAVLVEDF